MKLHEFQAKQIFAKYGITVPRGVVVKTPDEAFKATQDFGGSAVIKAQVHAGGRGKAGGVQLVRSSEEAKETIKKNSIVLFMKGTKDMPGCGFSAHVVQILNNMNVDYVDIDVLNDDDFKENMKKFTNWPTFPQLYVKGEFVGGCDIIKEMFESGELLELFNTKGIDVKI